MPDTPAISRLALVREADRPAARRTPAGRPVVRRYRLARVQPGNARGAERFAHLHQPHD